MFSRETTKKVVLASTGIVLGVAVAVLFYTTKPVILKQAQWTPDGDMLLTFYHRKNAILLTNPR